MAECSIREYDAKKMLAKALEQCSNGKIEYSGNTVLKTPDNNYDDLAEKNNWLLTEKLVVKPDQLFGKRGKYGLLGLNLTYSEVQKWISEKQEKEITIDKTSGLLTHFIIEPFVPHEQEYYISIETDRSYDMIRFSYEGGIEIEDNWEKILEIPVEINKDITKINFDSKLNSDENKDVLISFIQTLLCFYKKYNFTFLEINPFAIKDGKVLPLDMVAKVDDTAGFMMGKLWNNLEFPTSFGKKLLPEEQYIKDLDSKTGASLKLTILHPKGRIWTMVAGGGASVIYADTISDLGMGTEIANYGEYSGNPSMDETYEYAKTLLEMMLRPNDGKNRVLIIGGGIANFTDVAKTFTGINKALREFKTQLVNQKTKIYVRRGGPNYEEGLRNIASVGEEIDVPIEVYGPETHMTEIVRLGVEVIKAN